MHTNPSLPDWANQSVPGVDSTGVDSPGVDSPEENPLSYAEFITRLSQYKRAVYEAMYQVDRAIEHGLSDRNEQSSKNTNRFW